MQLCFLAPSPFLTQNNSTPVAVSLETSHVISFQRHKQHGLLFLATDRHCICNAKCLDRSACRMPAANTMEIWAIHVSSRVGQGFRSVEEFSLPTMVPAGVLKGLHLVAERVGTFQISTGRWNVKWPLPFCKPTHLVLPPRTDNQLDLKT